MQLVILILKTLISITRLITLRYDILCICIYFIYNWFYKPFVISKCKNVLKILFITPSPSFDTTIFQM